MFSRLQAKKVLEIWLETFGSFIKNAVQRKILKAGIFLKILFCIFVIGLQTKTFEYSTQNVRKVCNNCFIHRNILWTKFFLEIFSIS